MGIEQVELLSGSEAAKLRLEVLLANVAGKLSVDEACQELGLHKSRVFEVRQRWRARSREAVEPDPARRPGGRAAVLSALRERVLERHYINNLPTTIEREATGKGGPQL